MGRNKTDWLEHLIDRASARNTTGEYTTQQRTQFALAVGMFIGIVMTTVIIVGSVLIGAVINAVIT